MITQVFAQVFTYINAVMVNNIMLRKDLCHWTTGIQIRRNLATVEEWSQKRGLASLLNARFVEVTQVWTPSSILARVVVASPLCIAGTAIM